MKNLPGWIIATTSRVAAESIEPLNLTDELARSTRPNSAIQFAPPKFSRQRERGSRISDDLNVRVSGKLHFSLHKTLIWNYPYERVSIWDRPGSGHRIVGSTCSLHISVCIRRHTSQTVSTSQTKGNRFPFVCIQPPYHWSVAGKRSTNVSFWISTRSSTRLLAEAVRELFGDAVRAKRPSAQGACKRHI